MSPGLRGKFPPIAREEDIHYIETRVARWRRVRIISVSLAVFVIGLIGLGRFGLLGATQNDWQAYDRRSFTVEKASAGDRIALAGGTRVRMLGAAAPEVGKPGEDESRAYTQNRLVGRTVTIRLEPTQTRDADGLLLAYVFLTDGDNVNLDLVKDGHAYADRRVKHTFASAFEQAENDARRKPRGLWVDLRSEDQPAWRRQWLVAYLAKRQSSTQPSK